MTETAQPISRMNLWQRTAGVVFGDVSYQPEGTCGPRVQHDYQLVLLYTDGSSVTVNGQALALPARTVTLMRPGKLEHFAFSGASSTHHRWCAVHPALVSDDLQRALEAAPAQLPLSPHLHGLVELALTLPSQEPASLTALLDHLGLAALRQFVYEAEAVHERSAQPQALAAAREFMDTHLGDPITVSEVALAARVSPQHLIRLFRRHLGLTPGRYLWRARVERGLELLTATGLSIAEIAERCGFQNAFHFSRLVKAHAGLPPTTLRKQAWQRTQGEAG